MWSEMSSIMSFITKQPEKRIFIISTELTIVIPKLNIIVQGTIKLRILGYVGLICPFAVSNFNTSGKQTKLLYFLNHSRKDLTRHGSKYLNRMLLLPTLFFTYTTNLFIFIL